MPLCAAPIGLVPNFGLVRPPARKRLCARRRYEAGEPILRLDHPRWILAPRAGSIETGDGRRFFDPLLDLIAHSDNPNVRVSPELLALIARRDIAPNEPLTRNWGPGGQRDVANEDPMAHAASKRRVPA
ncbi:MAG TPA: hypothetical protein VK801_16265 [Caulobacteraceae bacterium]|jgi:hypothetical protein|nr:hypothetical protein [Caulobacteraceae bacterium]